MSEGRGGILLQKIFAVANWGVRRGVGPRLKWNLRPHPHGVAVEVSASLIPGCVAQRSLLWMGAGKCPGPVRNVVTHSVVVARNRCGNGVFPRQMGLCAFVRPLAGARVRAPPRRETSRCGLKAGVDHYGAAVVIGSGRRRRLERWNRRRENVADHHTSHPGALRSPESYVLCTDLGRYRSRWGQDSR